MTEEVTIKELLDKAGVDADSERYQELASYIATHVVYAVDLTDDASGANTFPLRHVLWPSVQRHNRLTGHWEKDGQYLLPDVVAKKELSEREALNWLIEDRRKKGVIGWI